MIPSFCGDGATVEIDNLLDLWSIGWRAVTTDIAANNKPTSNSITFSLALWDAKFKQLDDWELLVGRAAPAIGELMWPFSRIIRVIGKV